MPSVMAFKHQIKADCQRAGLSRRDIEAVTNEFAAYINAAGHEGNPLARAEAFAEAVRCHLQAQPQRGQ